MAGEVRWLLDDESLSRFPGKTCDGRRLRRVLVCGFQSPDHDAPHLDQRCRRQERRRPPPDRVAAGLPGQAPAVPPPLDDLSLVVRAVRRWRVQAVDAQTANIIED